VSIASCSSVGVKRRNASAANIESVGLSKMSASEISGIASKARRVNNLEMARRSNRTCRSNQAPVMLELGVRLVAKSIGAFSRPLSHRA